MSHSSRVEGQDAGWVECRDAILLPQTRQRAETHVQDTRGAAHRPHESDINQQQLPASVIGDALLIHCYCLESNSVPAR